VTWTNESVRLKTSQHPIGDFVGKSAWENGGPGAVNGRAQTSKGGRICWVALMPARADKPGGFLEGVVIVGIPETERRGEDPDGQSPRATLFQAMAVKPFHPAEGPLRSACGDSLRPINKNQIGNSART